MITEFFSCPIQINPLLCLAFVHPFGPNYVAFRSFSLLETMLIKGWKSIQNVGNWYILHQNTEQLFYLHSERGSCEELVSTFWVLLNNWQAAWCIPSNGTGALNIGELFLKIAKTCMFLKCFYMKSTRFSCYYFTF